jgi:parvulin-like peptidyl-prolyl isomerase
LAEVGTKIITARDLIERLELMPWPGKERPGLADSTKIHALQSIVAEQLLVLGANDQDIAKDSVWARRARTLERLMVRDQLYRRQVTPKITVTNAEIQEGIRRYASSLKLLLLTSSTEADSRKVYRTLARGSLDSVLQRISPKLLTRQDTLVITMGDVEKTLEDAAYNLQKGKQVAQPIQIQRLGWVVTVLLARFSNPKYQDLAVSARVQKVRSTLQQQKERERTILYQASILSHRKAEANPDLFERLASSALRILRGDSTGYRMQGGYTIVLIIDSLESILQPLLDKPFISMEDGSMTVWEVLEEYRFFRFYFPSLQDEDFRMRLNGSIRQTVAMEYLAREGYRQNLQNSEEVRHDVATWVDYWRAKEHERQLRGTLSQVTDDDVMNYLIQNGGILGSPYEVNVREVLTDSLQTAVRLFEQIVNGADMAEIARKYSKRKAWADRGGESLWFRVSGFPDIGFRALAADSGQLIGPVQLKNGYSLFRVLGKRQAHADSMITFDSLAALVHERVKSEKMHKLIDTQIASYARSYGVKMHYDRLHKIEITKQNMFTSRLIGFGGVMVAVPTLVPRWDWIKQVGDLKDLLP